MQSLLLGVFLLGTLCGAGAFALFSGATTDGPKGTITSPVRADHEPTTAEFEFWERLPRGARAADPSPYRDTPQDPQTRVPRGRSTAVEYLVQAGSFRLARDAETRRAELLLEGLDATTAPVRLGAEGTWHRVLVGPFDTRADTRRALTRLRELDIAGLLLERSATP